MAYLKSWNEWIGLRESNARKRAVKTSLNGTGPSLPGSYAACPSTNPVAMDVAKKTGVVKKRSLLKSESGQSPDYSFDRWLQKAQDLGDDVDKLVGHGKSEEEGIEKEKKNKEAEAKKADAKPKVDDNAKPKPDAKDKPKFGNQAEDDSEESKEAMSILKKIHKDRQKEGKDVSKQS